MFKSRLTFLAVTLMALVSLALPTSQATAVSTFGASSLVVDNTSSAASQVAIDLQPAVTASSAVAYGTRLQQTLTASANSDALTALYVNPTFADGAFTGVKHNGLIVASGNVGIGTTSPTSTLTVIGTISSSDGLTSDDFGYGATTGSNSESLALGYGATVSNSRAIAVGSNALASGQRGVALGTDASVSGSQSIAIGKGAAASAATAIALGYAAIADENNALIIGASGDPINNIYLGGGRVRTSAATYTLQASGGSGTDIAGSILQLAGGRGTGTGAGGALTFSTAAAGGVSGTTLNSLSERMRITSTGNVGIGTTGPTELLDINSDNLRVRTAKTPASATAACDQGEIAWDASFVYVCTATNTWKRSAIATW